MSAESYTPLTEEVILPAPPEIEIITTDRSDMDDYVQDFGAHRHGYNIRKGNSTTGLICHYHCHRGGFPPKTGQPTKSGRIGCKFKLTARPNHEKKSWMLIHIHLGHNHPADYTVKPRKRTPKTLPKPVNTNPINTHPSISKPPPVTDPHITDSHCSHHTESNTSLKTILSDVSARLEAMTPLTRQQKVQQIKCLLNEESTLAPPFKINESNQSNNSNNSNETQDTAKDYNTQEELSIDQMLNDILVTFDDNESPDNSHIQVELDLIPSPRKTEKNLSDTSHLAANYTPADSTGLSPLVDQDPSCDDEQSNNPDQSIKPNKFPVDSGIASLDTNPPISPRNLNTKPPPISQRMTTRQQSRQRALTETPAVTNPALPALMTKYEIPPWLADFVRDIHEVKADGHCGFRAISVAIGQSQDNWLYVRNKLADTIEEHPESFTQRQYTGTRLEAVARLRTSKVNVVLEQEYWLSMPSLGGVIATAFNRPVIYYGSDSNSLTMFPYISPPNENPPIVLALSNSHYCTLTLDYTLPDLPVPRLCAIWRRYASLEAAPWADRWKPHMERHAARLKRQHDTRKSNKRKKVTIHVD